LSPVKFCEGVCERALENFWQKCARIYDERARKLTIITAGHRISAGERGVNRSARQKFSAREQIPEVNKNLYLIKRFLDFG